eukprot:CAMPEP_0183307620 /NCGR_PEP_ID=MMETSP0160_2-20130417/18379_1 /TAXON_ID=2839 ORGANISM="Odontella Sinensis, Strain Grunow 1884" /NCGR_SAMPLE_ID=MMETSP0160_2 /ASSEMBLY_ACC=CAM_ASM_000250 /LENGTH=362 /DNA_ID=CAMNT_0025471243 /DNA_START=59 /DNA_END=1150 /DNA_ORIENTATION=+
MTAPLQGRYRGLTVLAVVLAFLAAPTWSATKKQKKKPIDTTRYADACTALSKARYPPLKPTDKRRHSAFRAAMEASGLQNMLLIDSPRLHAACWMMYDDASKLPGTHRRFLPRYALAVLYYTTQGPKWNKAEGWMTNSNECDWRGVKCTRPGWFYFYKYITHIDLGFNKLNGLVPREISLLKELRELDLNGNDIQGVLPHKMMSELKKLEVLKLHMNNILGKIPTEIGLMKSLRKLHIYGNYLQGELPKEIGKLPNLEVLDVSFTYMDGIIPSQIGNAKKLKEIYLDNCNFVGKVPSSLCKLKNLSALSADCLGRNPEVTCECCTICCQGLPDPKCVEMNPKGGGTNKKAKGKATTKKRKKY